MNELFEKRFIIEQKKELKRLTDLTYSFLTIPLFPEDIQEIKNLPGTKFIKDMVDYSPTYGEISIVPDEYELIAYLEVENRVEILRFDKKMKIVQFEVEKHQENTHHKITTGRDYSIRLIDENLIIKYSFIRQTGANFAFQQFLQSIEDEERRLGEIAAYNEYFKLLKCDQ
jgi:hypothetical protein